MRCKWCGGKLKQVATSEDICCKVCQLTWRSHSCLIGLMDGLGYAHNQLGSQIDSDLSRTGIGIADDWRLSRLIHQRFAYTNTYLDHFPQLNLCEIPEVARSSVEFIVCSDVLEHVSQPLSRAIQGLFSLLRPHGFAVITVPLVQDSQASEFYPNLESFEVADGVLTWTDSSGMVNTDESPMFHEGSGLVLVFRQITANSLISALRREGFMSVESPVALPAIGGESVDRTMHNVFIARKGSVE